MKEIVAVISLIIFEVYCHAGDVSLQPEAKYPRHDLSINFTVKYYQQQVKIIF